MTNEVRRLNQKIKVLEQQELPVKQVCCDLLRLFDLDVNDFSMEDSNYEYYVNRLLKNYKKNAENKSETKNLELFKN